VPDGATEFVIAGVQGGGIIDLAQANMVFDVESGTSAFDFSGALRGGNQLVKTGSGALKLQSPAALAGGAAVRDGLVILENPAFLRSPVVLGTGSTAGMIQHTGLGPWNNTVVLDGLGGGFLVAAGATTHVGGTIRATGDAARLLKDGDGTLDVTGAAFDGVGAALAGAGVLRGRAAALPGGLEALAGAAVEFFETADTTWTGTMSGAGSLVKSGNGLLTVAGALQQTGTLVVARGGVKLGSPDALPATARVALASGASLDLAWRDQTLAHLSNDGAIYLDAVVNSRAGQVLDWNTLRVTGSATGAGRVLVRLKESGEVDPLANSSETLVTTATPGVAWTAELAERAVYGPYDWAVEKAGPLYNLRLGVLSPEVAAAGGIDAATHLLGRASLSAISSRLTGARDGGQSHTLQIWGGWMSREDKLKSDLYDGARAKTDGLQAGIELNAIKAGGTPIVIGFWHDQGRGDFEMPGRVSDSVTKTYGVGAYVSYRTTPFYADLVLRNARENYDVGVAYAQQRHAFGTKGYSMAGSLEIGGVVSGGLPWSIEPQLQAVYQRHRIDDFTDTMGRDIDIATRDSVEGRAGVRVWRKFTGKAGRRSHQSFTPHLRASFVHEANENGAVNFIRGAGITDPVAFRNDLGGSMAMVDAGFMVERSRGLSLQATAAWYEGSRVSGFSANIFGAFAW
jgi:outer membrane autotransporter protein